LDFWPKLIFLLFVISFFSSWKNFRKKIKEAEGEEEMRNAVVPFLLVIFLFMIAIAVFIF